MNYRLIFDMQTSEMRMMNYMFVAPGAFILLFGLIVYLFRNRLSNPFRPKPMPRNLPFFLILFGLLWVQLSSLSLYVQYNALNQAIRAGKINVAEGKVTHFRPTSYLGSKSEQFCVSESEACFSYNDYVVTPGFNQTQSQGGPIQNGLPVKVTYKGNTIVKLEVGSLNAIASSKPNTDSPPAEVTLSPAR